MIKTSQPRHALKACWPNTTNFRKATKLGVVHRIRGMVDGGVLETEPRWLHWMQRAPPFDLQHLKVQDRNVRNPYPKMLRNLLQKYPNLRFQDCFVDGNDWSIGNDRYRDDHPAMQFVARQLLLINEGYSKRDAFKKVYFFLKFEEQA